MLHVIETWQLHHQITVKSSYYSLSISAYKIYTYLNAKPPGAGAADAVKFRFGVAEKLKLCGTAGAGAAGVGA